MLGLTEETTQVALLTSLVASGVWELVYIVNIFAQHVIHVEQVDIDIDEVFVDSAPSSPLRRSFLGISLSMRSESHDSLVDLEEATTLTGAMHKPDYASIAGPRAEMF